MDIVDTILNRGTDSIYPSKEEFEKVLRSGKKLKIYQGFDPTGIDLHIGHFVGLMKLRQFQKAGHEVIFLIGDGTGQAGDPSGKSRSREKYLSNKELRDNARDYVMQAKKIVDFDGPNPVKILYNGDWLNKLTLKDILDIAGHFTAQQMNERDLFQQRYKNNIPLNLREFLYPLLQGYDSVAMDVDVEVGGTDQVFNMLAGRQLLKAVKGKDKFVLATPLLADKSGKKIGKTEGNAIALSDPPQDLYAKIMSLPDDVIVTCFEYLTEIPMSDIKNISDAIKNGENPMKFKKQLAFEIVKFLNSEDAAIKAQDFFEKTHQSKILNVSINVPVINLKITQPTPLIDVVVKHLNISKSELKRLIKQNAVDVNNKNINDYMYLVKKGDLIKVGKHNIFRI